MDRAEALTIANELVTDWTGQVKNQQGYVHDRWAPTSLRDRTEATIKLAEFLLDQPVPSRLTAPDVTG